MDIPLSRSFTQKENRCSKIIMSKNANIAMTVYGDNGIRCHGEKISTLKANGYIGYPMHHRLPFAIKRTARFEVKGSLPSSTQILPTEINLNSRD